MRSAKWLLAGRSSTPQSDKPWTCSRWEGPNGLAGISGRDETVAVRTIEAARDAVVVGLMTRPCLDSRLCGRRKRPGYDPGQRPLNMIICRSGRWAHTNRDLRQWAGIDNRRMLELFRHDV